MSEIWRLDEIAARETANLNQHHQLINNVDLAYQPDQVAAIAKIGMQIRELSDTIGHELSWTVIFDRSRNTGLLWLGDMSSKNATAGADYESFDGEKVSAESADYQASVQAKWDAYELCSKQALMEATTLLHLSSAPEDWSSLDSARFGREMGLGESASYADIYEARDRQQALDRFKTDEQAQADDDMRTRRGLGLPFDATMTRVQAVRDKLSQLSNKCFD